VAMSCARNWSTVALVQIKTSLDVTEPWFCLLVVAVKLNLEVVSGNVDREMKVSVRVV
jgi:hypothetical protein